MGKLRKLYQTSSLGGASKLKLAAKAKYRSPTNNSRAVTSNFKVIFDLNEIK